MSLVLGYLVFRQGSTLHSGKKDPERDRRHLHPCSGLAGLQRDSAGPGIDVFDQALDCVKVRTVFGSKRNIELL